MNKYQKTDLSKIFQALDLKENNFISIVNEFDYQINDSKVINISYREEIKNEAQLKSDEKVNKINLQESNNNSISPSIEIFDNGSMEIKNNKNSEKKINNKDISAFNEGEDNLLINNINNDKQNININNNFNIINDIKSSPKRKNEIYFKEEINFNKNNIINENQNSKEDLKNLHLAKEYRQTDVSKIIKNADILKTEKFNQMIEYIENSIYLDNNNLGDYNSSNVRLNLDSDIKTKREQFFYAIPEEDNESYDSLSLHKSIRSSIKVTPNLSENKKKSINDIRDLNINNNLFKTFNKDKSNINNINNNNFMIEEINIGEEEDEKQVNNNKNNIKIIDFSFKSGDNNDVNYTTPESKEKIIEYENVNIINDERNNISGPKEFSTPENDEIKFSDFNTDFNENEKKENIYINNKENINIIASNNIIDINNNSKLGKEIKIKNDIKKDILNDKYFKFDIIDKKNKKILFLGDENRNGNDKNKIFKIKYSSYIRILQLCLNPKPPKKKLYENFMKHLLKKLLKDVEDLYINKIEVTNNIIDNKLEKDIKNLENEIKYLKECYLYLIVKKSVLKPKSGLEKLINDIDLSKKKKKIEKLLDNLLFNLKGNEKQNNYYIKKIRNILNKYQSIHQNEITEAIKEEGNKLKYPIDREFNLNHKNSFDKIKNIFLVGFQFILPLIFISIFLILQSKKQLDI